MNISCSYLRSRVRVVLAVLVAALGVAAATMVGVAPAAHAVTAQYTTEATLFNFTDRTLTDSSSWAVSHRTSGIRWTNQDRTYQKAEIRAIDNAGNTVSKVTMTGPGVTHVDPEDLATVTLNTVPYVYVFDGGGNADRRTSVTVSRIVEPTGAAIRANPIMSVAAQTWTFTYPTGEEFAAGRTVGPNSEAMLVDPRTGRMYFVIKDTTGQASGVTYLGVYTATTTAAAATPGTYPLKKVGAVPKSMITTAGTFSPDGALFALRTYDRIYVYRTNGTDLAPVINANQPVAIILPRSSQEQGEGVSFSADGKALELSTEWHTRATAPVFRETLPAGLAVAPVPLIT